jgi:predicted enzyme related to lactoylglutathione lyase
MTAFDPLGIFRHRPIAYARCSGDDCAAVQWQRSACAAARDQVRVNRMSDAPITAMVPLAHVRDMSAAIDFYEKLGLQVANSVTAPGAQIPNWALLRSNRAELMLAKADEPVLAEHQGILFYTYCPDIAATHAAVRKAGLSPGRISKPFYNPGGEFRLVDPDGYVIYVAQI